MTGRTLLGVAVPMLFGALPALLLPLGTGVTATDAPASNGIHRIRHVVIIMQENRSFDSYFGTFPGADGIPLQNGVPTVCVPDPKSNTCVRPYHDPKDRNAGGPHAAKNAAADIDGGKMDGFVEEAQAARRHCRNAERGRFPRRPAHRPGERRQARPTPGCAGERRHPR